MATTKSALVALLAMVLACEPKRSQPRPPESSSVAAAPTEMNRSSALDTATYAPSSARARAGRLAARPAAVSPAGGPADVGKIPLCIAGERDGWLYVPPPRAGSRATDPMPLVVMFHGAGGRAEHVLDMMRPLADEQGFLVLAPNSRASTWDVIDDELGPDVALVDAALAKTFATHAVSSVAVGGFSDGASYALTLGMANGDLFDTILAFSPGYSAAPSKKGSPRVFVSHGTNDGVLPIDRCSRRLVPRLRREGYEVRYDEFDGPHTVPPPIAREATLWMLQGT